jgi:hypothetical protein
MQHNISDRKFENSMRKFCSSWYSDFGNWIEYSFEKDAVFCHCYYLFKLDIGKQYGGDTFVIEALMVFITLHGRNVKIDETKSTY